MAIRLTLARTERILFCGSKWWGDPDLPENIPYPTVRVTDEDGETYDYPLTFICQINCEDIARFDSENRLPHEGMLYFFGAIDSFIGYDSPVVCKSGEWPKGNIVVKYAKNVNFEIFQSCILVDDDDRSLTEPELEISFSECKDSEACLKMNTGSDEGTVLLQIISDEMAGTDFGKGNLDIVISDQDLKFGNWKRAKGILRQ